MHCVHSHCCSMFIYQNHCSCSEGDVIVLPWGYLIYEPASSDDDDHDGVQTWKANFDPGGAEGGRGHCIMWGRKKGPPLVLFIYLVWQYAIIYLIWMKKTPSLPIWHVTPTHAVSNIHKLQPILGILIFCSKNIRTSFSPLKIVRKKSLKYFQHCVVYSSSNKAEKQKLKRKYIV